MDDVPSCERAKEFFIFIFYEKENFRWREIVVFSIFKLSDIFKFKFVNIITN